jgi:hypothetical protein
MKHVLLLLSTQGQDVEVVVGVKVEEDPGTMQIKSR